MKYRVDDIFATPSEQARGLMFREDYPEDACAAFLYHDRPRVLSFHGRNCLFPIIAAFFRKDLTLDCLHVLEPDGEPASSVGECSLVVEVKATERNIAVVSQCVRAAIDKNCISLL